MISRIRAHFGTTGLVIAVIALIAALAGTAYAATKLNSTQKKEVEKIAKKVSKPGPKGATGPQGPKGDPGAGGANGAPGAPGSPGDDGISVTTTAATAGECPNGGIKFTSATGSAKICNGANGSPGVPGPPGPPGPACPTADPCFLPAESTETGIWGSGAQTPIGRHTFQISFNMPLQAPPTPIVVQPEENSAPGCPGRGGGAFPATGEFKPTVPEADPGNLCIYLDKMENTSAVSAGSSVKRTVYEEGVWYNEPGVSPAGAFLEVICTAECYAMGSWAVTAPAE